MPWNYRLMRRKCHNPVTKQDEFYYTMHEVFYDADTPDAPFSYTKNAIDVGGDSVEDVKWMLEAMLKSLDKPVLDYEEDDATTSLGSEPRKNEDAGEGLGQLQG